MKTDIQILYKEGKSEGRRYVQEPLIDRNNSLTNAQVR